MDIKKFRKIFAFLFATAMLACTFTVMTAFASAEQPNGLDDINVPDPFGITVPSTPKTWKLGDVDDSGSIDIEDMILVRNHILGAPLLTGDPFLAADINDDGYVDIEDLVAFRNHILGTDLIVDPDEEPNIGDLDISETGDTVLAW